MIQTFARRDLERFLREVDRSLDQPTRVIVIGGTAATLRYGASRATQDIDTLTNVSASLSRAVLKAQAKTGLRIPIQRVTVADEPENYESRLQRAMPRLTRLRVMVPERHDLVLMKAMRAYDHDLQVIAEIHANSPLDLDTLVSRFVEEMTPIGPERRIRQNFLLVVERLFPNEVDAVESRLKAR
jgi:hypothetical protein